MKYLCLVACTSLIVNPSQAMWPCLDGSYDFASPGCYEQDTQPANPNPGLSLQITCPNSGTLSLVTALQIKNDSYAIAKLVNGSSVVINLRDCKIALSQ